jgi:SAM-dependent methyltransferase
VNEHAERSASHDAGHGGAAFRTIARAYDLLVNEEKRWANERDALAAWLDQAGARARRVLDLGCGTGFHARHCAAHLDAQVTASDPALEMLEVARRKPHGDRVHWEIGTAEAPPPGQYDLIVLLGNTMSLIPETDAVFEAAARVAAPNALLVIQTLDYDALRRRGEQIVERSGSGISISKRLRPLTTDPPAAAELTLRIRDADGHTIAIQEEKLLDHASYDLEQNGARHGWSLIERRRSYRDPNSGDDRILVFRFEGERTAGEPSSVA